ncbi:MULTISPECIES: NAD(P)/FAD-dependent oxidoreductase [unclassified Pigmentiphaga]|uniref:phytoene desaturase family protein n=1 Tax=unclassified Pigmentiphaga TaxID=2626614 RepID=UPI000B408E8E|nr:MULTISPECIES: NAD(P)/FAD-dependent oxidoreductase [unclassified Pigmentiphaga]OVZ65585.1 phytoene dehydrogenase [Pigmentiphaga sp. NML030171]
MGRSIRSAMVVGAGLSGLAASVALARQGVDVVLAEAGEEVGGCCSTVSEQGFTFNNGAVYVAVPSLLRSGFARLGMDVEREIELAAIARPHATHLDDGTVVRLAGVEDSLVEGDAARTAMLRDGLDALRRRWAPIYRTLVQEVLPFEPALARTLGRLWRYLPALSGRADRLIAGHFPDAGLQAAVASTLLYTGMGPERLPATQIIGLVALLEEGFHLPRGGMGAISQALYRAAQRHGVRILCGRPVERITVAGGVARGVALAGGERIQADCVIAACSGFDVVHRLLPADAVPWTLARRARRAPLSHRAISIQLGGAVAEGPGAFIVNHVPLMREQGRLHVMPPDAPRWLAYTCPTQVLPDLAPPGRSILELYAPVSGIASADEWTPDMTRSAVDRYLAAMRQRVPGLEIDAVRVLDPRDFVRQRHLYEGALYGVAPGASPDRFFPHRTPLRGLYLAGQTTFPGYGVPSAILSGIQAAEAAEAATGGAGPARI